MAEMMSEKELELLRKLTIVSWPDDPSKHGAERRLAMAVPALLDEVTRLRARAADVDDAKRIWADETLRKVPRLSDGTEYEVGTLVVMVDEERHKRVGLGYTYNDRVHRISSLLGGYGIECGPQQFGRMYLKRAPEGAEVTCPYCAGWPEQIAKMRADAEVYRRTREIEDERDIVRSAIRSLALLAREGFSRGWDDLDARDKNAAIDALLAKAIP